MELLTIDNAKSLLKKINNAKQISPVNSKSVDTGIDVLCVYEFSFDSVNQDDNRHIALAPLENENGILIYVNQFSIHKFSYFDFFDSEAWVVEKYAKGRNPNSPYQSFHLLLNKSPSLRPTKNYVLKLRLKMLKDFRILLLWYVGYSYTQDEIRKMLLADNYNFPDSPFEIHSSKPINKKLLKRGGLLKYLNALFRINDKPFLHRREIKKIIGEKQEVIFFDTETSDYFKVLSLFKFLSMANDKWYRLICKNMEFPSLSNNPVTLEYDGFIDQESIHARETKRINDAILRCFYNQLIQSALIKQPSLKSILLSDNECFTGFDIRLSEFDIYFQKLIDLCVVRKGIDLDGCISDRVDEAFSDARRYTDALLQKFEVEYSLIESDDLVLTLIKYSSINRALSDCDCILNIYADIEHDIPYKIDLMKSVRGVNEIIDVLQKIFDIEKNEIPEDLIQCATIVNEMFSRFYDREATSEKRNEFKTKVFSPAYVGASAVLLLNGYIKSNKYKSRTKSNKDFKIRIRGESVPGINVYNELSKLEKIYTKGEKSLSALLYCMPDDLYKFLTARYSIVHVGMGSCLPVKNAALNALIFKKRKIELQKEFIDKFKYYSIEQTYEFVKYFKSNVIKFESFLKDPVCIINLWLSH